MADAMDSKSIVGDNVWVQVPPSAPKAPVRTGAFLYHEWDLNGWGAPTEIVFRARKAAPNASERSVCHPGER